MNRALARRLAVGFALVAWTAVAFWAFSFGFSATFFQYDFASRLPPLVAALLAALAIPVSAFGQWSRMRQNRTSRLRAWFTHLFCTLALLVAFAVIAALLGRAAAPFRLAGDDAMGVAYDFLMLAGLGIASVLILAIALAIARPRDQP
jgi:hypothetical protein